MANDVIIATVPATEVESAPVEVAEVSAVDEAEIVAPAVDFKIDGDVLKGTLLPLLAMRKPLQRDKHATAVEVFANDDGLTLQTVGEGFAAQKQIEIEHGYLPCSDCHFALSYIAAEFVAKQFDGEKLYSVAKIGRRISFCDNDGSHCDFNDQSEIFGGAFVIDSPKFTMSPSALSEALSRVLYATTKDSGNVFDAVNFSAQNGTLTLAATDGKRLATSTSSAEAVADFSINIPARVLQAIKPLLADKGSVEFSDNFITVNNWVFKFAPIAAVFPPLDKVLSEEIKAFVSFGVKDMLDAVKFVAPATNGDKTIALEFANGHVTITAKTNGKIKDGLFAGDDESPAFNDATAQVSRSAELHGAQNVRFAINANYLLDVLKPLPREISTIALGIKNQMVSIKGNAYQAVVATFGKTSVSKKLPIAAPAPEAEFPAANMPESVAEAVA